MSVSCSLCWNREKDKERESSFFHRARRKEKTAEVFARRTWARRMEKEGRERGVRGVHHSSAE